MKCNSIAPDNTTRCALDNNHVGTHQRNARSWYRNQWFNNTEIGLPLLTTGFVLDTEQPWNGYLDDLTQLHADIDRALRAGYAPDECGREQVGTWT